MEVKARLHLLQAEVLVEEQEREQEPLWPLPL